MICEYFELIKYLLHRHFIGKSVGSLSFHQVCSLVNSSVYIYIPFSISSKCNQKLCSVSGFFFYSHFVSLLLFYIFIFHFFGLLVLVDKYIFSFGVKVGSSFILLFFSFLHILFLSIIFIFLFFILLVLFFVLLMFVQKLNLIKTCLALELPLFFSSFSSELVHC